MAKTIINIVAVTVIAAFAIIGLAFTGVYAHQRTMRDFVARRDLAMARLTARLVDDGLAHGIVGTDGRGLDAWLPPVAADQPGAVIVVDSEGQALYHSDPQRTGAGLGADPGVVQALDRREGAIVVTGEDGASILVGRTGRDNDRLTFKIAGPEDFWLHVQGRPGAHVVIRNPGRRRRPSRDALEEAAALAAWYSGARSEGQVDVHWTRRKYVRRVRGAPFCRGLYRVLRQDRAHPVASPGHLSQGPLRGHS